MKKKLIENILQLSHCKDFEEAKGIWLIACAYLPKEDIVCLCGKTHVIQAVRFNKMNSKIRIDLCSECASEMSGLKFNLIFNDIDKFRNNNNHKVATETLDYLIDSNQIDRRTYYSYSEQKKGPFEFLYVNYILEVTIRNPDYVPHWKIRLEKILEAQKD